MSLPKVAISDTELLMRRVDRLERVVGLGKLQINMAPSDLTLGGDGTAIDAKGQLMAVRYFLQGLIDSGQLNGFVREQIRCQIEKIVV